MWRRVFTGKYTTGKIHYDTTSGTSDWLVSHIVTSEDIDDAISRFFMVVCTKVV